MDWQVTLLLGILFFGFAILWSRTVKRVHRWMIVLSLPIMFFLLRWVFYRDSWVEFVVAIGIGALIFMIWWFAYGRKLPPPQESQIIVITDDDEGQ